MIEVGRLRFFDVLRQGDFIFCILVVVIDVGIPDTIVLVPLHLAGDERCHRNILFCFGSGSFLHVKKIRVIPSVHVIDRQVLYFPFDGLLPPKISILVVTTVSQNIPFRLFSLRCDFGGRLVENGRLEISFLSTFVIIFLKLGLFVDSSRIQRLAGNGTSFIVNFAGVAVVVIIHLLLEGGIGIDAGAVVDAGSVAEGGRSEDVVVLSFEHLN